MKNSAGGTALRRGLRTRMFAPLCAAKTRRAQPKAAEKPTKHEPWPALDVHSWPPARRATTREKRGKDSVAAR